MNRLRPHPFRPDPGAPGFCVCGLPASNTTMHVAAASTPDISESRHPPDRDQPAGEGDAHRLTPGQRKTLGVFAAAGLRGLTGPELTRRTGLEPNDAGQHRGVLARAGLVARLRDPQGRFVTRGPKKQTVWVATPTGRDVP